MLHHPVKLASLGMKSGPSSLALNRIMQIVARIPVGIIATRGYLSPIRMSQIAKIILVLSTILCNYISANSYQFCFYFFIGIWGSVINIADFLLIRESVSANREFGAALFNLLNGALNLPFMTLIGYLFEKIGSYDVPYLIVAAFFGLAFILALLYELVAKRNKRFL